MTLTKAPTNIRDQVQLATKVGHYLQEQQSSGTTITPNATGNPLAWGLITALRQCGVKLVKDDDRTMESTFQFGVQEGIYPAGSTT